MSYMLASDDNNPAFAGARNPDAALHVRFQMLSIFQVYDSTQPFLPNPKTGEPDETRPNPRFTGSPVYKDVPHIEISVPSESGLCLLRTIEVARPDHKIRFPRQWQIFEMSQGTGDQVIGTKLSEWPAITRSRAEELRAMKYYVVEQIANASDAQVQGIGMDGTTLRRKAQEYLKVAKDVAHAERQSAEINKLREEQAAKDAAHSETLRQMQEQLAKLTAAMQEPKAAPKRRGRPPKAEAAQQPVEA